ncbi:MAG: hypothetical protein E6Q85_03900 [Thiothrix sp.]|nr:MAG: hypothetical protein E6Q85_03900 [Thiothrix sp.]
MNEMNEHQLDEYMNGWVANGLGIEREDSTGANANYLQGYDDYDRGFFAPNPSECPESHQHGETTGDYIERVHLALSA